jgi:hypothetical protein
VKHALDRADHRLIGLLIRDNTLEEAAGIMNLPVSNVRSQMDRIRKFLGCRTTYGVIALEVVNLMEADEEEFAEITKEPKEKAMGAAA